MKRTKQRGTPQRLCSPGWSLVGCGIDNQDGGIRNPAVPSCQDWRLYSWSLTRHPGGGRRPVENMQKLLGETWNGEMSLFFLFVRFYWVVCGLVALTFYSTT